MVLLVRVGCFGIGSFVDLQSRALFGGDSLTYLFPVSLSPEASGRLGLRCSGGLYSLDRVLHVGRIGLFKRL